MLGAGGSSRAVVFGLLERGISRSILPTAPWRGPRRWPREFGPDVHPLAWDGIDELLPRAKLLVNTTSLGMHGQPARGRCGRLPQAAIVADLVYVPLVTPLLAAAQARGLKTADGLGMLLHQAVRASSCGSASGLR